MASILPFAHTEERPQRSAGGSKHSPLDVAAAAGRNRSCEIVIFPGVRVEYHDCTADTVGAISVPTPPEADAPKPVGGKRGRKAARRSLSV